MPQERGTVEMLLEQKLARGVQTPDDIIPIVETLLPALNRADVKLPSKHNFDLTDTAVYTAAEKVLNMCGVKVPPALPAQPVASNEEIYVKVS